MNHEVLTSRMKFQKILPNSIKSKRDIDITLFYVESPIQMKFTLLKFLK